MFIPFCYALMTGLAAIAGVLFGAWKYIQGRDRDYACLCMKVGAATVAACSVCVLSLALLIGITIEDEARRLGFESAQDRRDASSEHFADAKLWKVEKEKRARREAEDQIAALSAAKAAKNSEALSDHARAEDEEHGKVKLAERKPAANSSISLITATSAQSYKPAPITYSKTTVDTDPVRKYYEGLRTRLPIKLNDFVSILTIEVKDSVVVWGLHSSQSLPSDSRYLSQIVGRIVDQQCADPEQRPMLKHGLVNHFNLSDPHAVNYAFFEVLEQTCFESGRNSMSDKSSEMSLAALVPPETVQTPPTDTSLGPEPSEQSTGIMEQWPGQFFADNRRHGVVLACPDPETVFSFRHLAATQPQYLDGAGMSAIGLGVCHFRAGTSDDVQPVVPY